MCGGWVGGVVVRELGIPSLTVPNGYPVTYSHLVFTGVAAGSACGAGDAALDPDCAGGGGQVNIYIDI